MASPHIAAFFPVAFSIMATMALASASRSAAAFARNAGTLAELSCVLGPFDDGVFAPVFLAAIRRASPLAWPRGRAASRRWAAIPDVGSRGEIPRPFQSQPCSASPTKSTSQTQCNHSVAAFAPQRVRVRPRQSHLAMESPRPPDSAVAHSLAAPGVAAPLLEPPRCRRRRGGAPPPPPPPHHPPPLLPHTTSRLHSVL